MKDIEFLEAYIMVNGKKYLYLDIKQAWYLYSGFRQPFVIRFQDNERIEINNKSDDYGRCCLFLLYNGIVINDFDQLGVVGASVSNEEYIKYRDYIIKLNQPYIKLVVEECIKYGYKVKTGILEMVGKDKQIHDITVVKDKDVFTAGIELALVKEVDGIDMYVMNKKQEYKYIVYPVAFKYPDKKIEFEIYTSSHYKFMQKIVHKLVKKSRGDNYTETFLYEI